MLGIPAVKAICLTLLVTTLQLWRVDTATTFSIVDDTDTYQFTTHITDRKILRHRKAKETEQRTWGGTNLYDDDGNLNNDYRAAPGKDALLVTTTTEEEEQWFWDRTLQEEMESFPETQVAAPDPPCPTRVSTTSCH